MWSGSLLSWTDLPCSLKLNSVDFKILFFLGQWFQHQDRSIEWEKNSQRPERKSVRIKILNDFVQLLCMPTIAVGSVSFMFWVVWLKWAAAFSKSLRKMLGLYVSFFLDGSRAVIVALHSLVNQYRWIQFLTTKEELCFCVVGVDVWK